jgi:hypothetical protein
MSRTSWITIAAVAAVVVASGAAIATNIGVLDAADDSTIGQLSAAGDLVGSDVPAPEVSAGVGDGTEPTPLAGGVFAGGEQFAIDDAGVVSVLRAADGVRLGDVVANPGWTWALTQTDSASLSITFTDGERTLRFDATAGDGTIAASVDEPTTATGFQHEGDEDEHEGRDDDD